jgi:TolB-like protein
MYKKLTVLLLLFIPVFAFAQNSILLEQALDNCVAQFRNQLPRGARVAILKIDTKSDGLAEYIADNLSAKLVAQNYLTVVERGRALRVLESEQNYQTSGNVSDETATIIGKQLGAELVVTGSITSSGDLYNINIRVVHVETTRIQSQYAANNVKPDPSIANMSLPTLTVVARFAGTALEINDQDSFVQDIQRALDQYGVPVEIVLPDDAPPGADYNFLITFRVNQRANLLSADLTVALRRGSRVLKQSDRQTFSELNMEYLVRKGGEVIRNDRTFFQALPGIVAQQ